MHGRPRWRILREWAAVVLLFGACGLMVMLLDRVQTRTISGVPAVIDGDTLTVSGSRIRLKGIDAFERDQICFRDGHKYDCGAFAREMLVGLVDGRQVECSGRTFDRYRRLLAVCRIDGRDVNAWMVESGWALAYGDYEAEALRARRSRSGAWAGEFDQPSAWRAVKGGMAESPHDLLRTLWQMLRSMLVGSAASA